MARLRPLRPHDLDPEQRSLYDAITTGPRAGSGVTDEDGCLRGPFDPLLRVPVVGDAVQQLGAALRYGGVLPDDLRELAIVAVAGWCRCDFEMRVHASLAERAGVDPAVVAAISEGAAPDLAEGSGAKAVHSAAVELLASHRMTEPTYTALVDAVGEAGVVELVVLVGYYSLLAGVLEGFEIS